MRAFLPLVSSLFVAVLGTAPVAHAQNANSAPQVDLARGEALYTQGDASRNVLACVSCHGAAGNSTIAQYPKLASQHGAYFAKQMADFRTAQRNDPVMSPIAKALSDADVKNIAAFLEKQQLKAGAARSKDTVEFGKKIYRGGIAEKNVPACASCHGASGGGIPAQFARLGGQHQDYTVGQMVKFRDHLRNNSHQMTTIARRMTDDEIKAVADYIAGLR